MKLSTSTLFIIISSSTHLVSSTPIATIVDPIPIFERIASTILSSSSSSSHLTTRDITTTTTTTNNNNNAASNPDTKVVAVYTCPPPIEFTSTFRVVATADQVVNGTTSKPGEAGAVGYYNFGFNSIEDVVCYNITLYGVSGDYMSPAATATHIHSALKGASGPPRIAFPNPVPVNGDISGNGKRVSIGCLSAPFVTGVKNTTTNLDQGSASGFKIRQIEENPSAYMADAHTVKFSVGVVRGQFSGYTA